MINEAYSIADAARMLGVPQRTMRQAIDRGRLVAHRPGPRRTYVYWSDVLAWRATRSPDQRADQARRAAQARWHPDTMVDDRDEGQPVVLVNAAASSRLTHALIDLTDRGGRPRCGDPDTRDLWLSDRSAQRAAAARLCTGCPVLAECGAAAEANNEQFGVWAGVDRTRTRSRTGTQDGNDTVAAA